MDCKVPLTCHDLSRLHYRLYERHTAIKPCRLCRRGGGGVATAGDGSSALGAMLVSSEAAREGADKALVESRGEVAMLQKELMKALRATGMAGCARIGEEGGRVGGAQHASMHSRHRECQYHMPQYHMPQCHMPQYHMPEGRSCIPWEPLRRRATVYIWVIDGCQG